MRGVFVTGTDTGVGKTVAAACLVRAWDADYWKPVQTGLTEEADDAATVAKLARTQKGRMHASTYALQAPLSPHAAAALEGIAIDMTRFALPKSGRPVVVEGAGGLLVPLGDHCFMADLIARLELPAVLVARSSLGTINHTLLSLEALARRTLPVAGIILVGEPNHGNREAIAHFGHCRILAELPHTTPLDARAVDRLSALLPSFATLIA